MTDLRKAAEMALTALDTTCPNTWHSVRENLRKALAQPEQEPVAWLTDEDLKPLCDEWRIMYGGYVDDFAKAIEAKLKEKNT